jgi:hypothetical protein
MFIAEEYELPEGEDEGTTYEGDEPKPKRVAEVTEDEGEKEESEKSC